MKLVLVMLLLGAALSLHLSATHDMGNENSKNMNKDASWNDLKSQFNNRC